MLFQSALPRGERLRLSWRKGGFFGISIRAPARGATSQHRSCSQGLKFQSALPRGERLASQCMIIGAVCISIRAPARGATQSIPIILCNRNNFNPRSREGSDSHSIATNDIFHISIRAPARGATLYYVALFIYILISIRAPARGAT